MNIIRKHIIGRIIAIVLFFALMFPISVKFLHIFENHLHEICSSKDAKHIHQLENDCEFYKFKINTPLALISFDFKISNNIEVLEITTELYNFKYNHQQLPFALRAPPELA